MGTGRTARTPVRRQWILAAVIFFAGLTLASPSSADITWIQNVNNAVASPCVAGYSYVRTVTIDHTKVPNTNQSNFPVLFSGTYNGSGSGLDLRTTGNGGKVTNSSGFDIIFTDGAGTKLDHEIESYSATTGAVNFWVRVPTVSTTTDTVISLCYGNAAVSTSQENKTGVWDANFKGVWHLKENPAGAAPQMKDSTATANNGTSMGSMTSANQVAGRIDGSLSLNGTSNYIQGPDYDILNAITVSAWVNWNVVSTTDGIVSKRTSSEALGDWDLRLSDTGSGQLEWMLWSAVDSSQNVYSVSTITPGAWTHVVATFDDATNTVKLYINGVLDKTDTSITNSLANTAEQIAIGWGGQGSQYFNGIIDEVRLSSAVRSADWVKTEYNNQNSPSTFYALGAETGGSGATSITSPALSQAILAGDLIVVSVRAPTGTWTVTDNQGQTYILATGPTNNHSIYYKANSVAVAANTLTVTATTTGTPGIMRIFVDVFRGAATQNVLDTTATVTAKNAATSCTVISDSNPSAGFGELVYMTAGMTNTATYTACTTNGVPMIIGGQTSSGGTGSMFSSYALSSASGAQNAAVQASAGCVGCLNGGVAVFKPDCPFNFRKSITVQPGMVGGGPLTNFPLLVSFTDAQLKTTANGGNVTNANGYDIIFRASDGVTQLDHEIERYVSTTGELVAWVRVPSINTGTVIYMYYGNSCVTSSTENPAGIWPAYVGVWHLSESSGTGYYLKNSVQNNYYANVGSTLYLSSSNIDGGRDFNSSLLSVQNGAALLGGDTVFTVQLWAYPDYATDAIWQADGESMFLRSDPLSLCRWRRESTDPAGTGTIQCDVTWSDTTIDYFVDNSHLLRAQWNHIVLTYDGSTLRWYINGVARATTSHPGKTLRTNSQLTFGIDIGLTMDSNFDEYRYAKAAQSAGWITTEYNNQKPSSTFFAVGNQELLQCTYTFRKSITVQAGMVSGGPLTNFPFLVSLTDANLKTTANGGNVTNANGYDIIFRASDGVTQLDHEIERYTAATGELVAWVRVPSINNGTVIYMYYGNSCVISPTQNPTGVWDANFKGVWHLAEATAANRLDSTSNANTLTPSASNPTQVAGKINGSANFASASSQYLTIPGLLSVVVDTSASAKSTSSSTTFSWTHTASGTNRVVIVGVSYRSSSATATATYGGTSMTLLGSKLSSTDTRMAMFSLVNPPTGLQTITVTFSVAVSQKVGGSMSMTGVNQTTPTGAFFSATGNSSTASLTATSATGELVIDTVSYDSSCTSITPNASQTQRWNLLASSPDTFGGGSTKAGAASVPMSWTCPPTGDHWAYGAVSVKPAPGATSLDITGPITVEAWVNLASVNLTMGVVDKWRGSAVVTADPPYLLRAGSGDATHDRAAFLVSPNSTTGNTPVQGPTNSMAASTWYRIVGVYDGTNLHIYRNGVEDATPVAYSSGMWISDGAFEVGTRQDQYFNGIIDEVRVSNVARSAGWLLTEYNNQNSTSSFFAVGAQEGPGALNAYESSYYPGAITGFIRTKKAGATVSLDMIALNAGKTAIDTSTTWSGRTVTVEVLDASTNSGTFANNCWSSWVPINPPGSVTKTFPTCTAGNCGRTTISLAMPANSYPNARLRITYATGPIIGCSTDNFAIRPNTLANLAVTDTDWQTTGTPGARALNLLDFSATTPIHKAGRPFSVQATAKNVNGTTTTTNYTGSPTATPSACVGGAACTSTFGTMTFGTAFVAGALPTNATATYDNVGSFALQLQDQTFSSVDSVSGDTPGTCTDRYVCSPTLSAGRFVPDHFAVSLNTPTFGTACGTGAFTYIGQAFNYTTAPVITVTAQNFANGTTTLYAGSWGRFTNAAGTSLNQAPYNTQDGRYSRFDALGGGTTPARNTAGLPATTADPSIGTFTAGVGTLTFSSGTGLLFTRSTPVAPFNADISLAINVIDADGVASASTASFGAASLNGGIAFNNGKAMYFGRLRLGNALGSELLDLPIPLVAEYWNGTYFVTNTLDNCTSIAAANIKLQTGSYQGGVTSSNMPQANVSISGNFSAGVSNLKLTKPTSAVSPNGSVDLCVDLDTAPGVGDTACQATTSANKTYLQGVWSGTNYDRDPSSRAGFGFSGASNKTNTIIYQRENF